MASTTFAGAFFFSSTDPSDLFAFLVAGTAYSVPLMTILLVHEMGHYTASRARRLDASLPYFIPAPIILGTLGAFIRIRSPITNKRTLMEVGSLGPIAGFVVTVPLLVVGMMLSEVRPVAGTEVQAGLTFGSSILVELMSYMVFGSMTDNVTVILHPTAVAAYFGLLVTAMNLLPMGQLDGGHVIYALFGHIWARRISITFFCLLMVMGYFLFPGWMVFGVLGLILGLRHPEPIDPYTPLDRVGQILGTVSLAILVLTFVPVPIEIWGV